MKGMIFKEDILKAKLEVYKARGEFVTRRLIKFPYQNSLGEWLPVEITPDGLKDRYGNIASFNPYVTMWHTRTGGTLKPPYQPGEQVYIREPFCWKVDPITSHLLDEFWYKVDGANRVEYLDDGDGGAVVNQDGTFRSPWLSPYAMKESYARHKPFVVDVRPERLQDITIGDSVLEGIEGWDGYSVIQPFILFAQLWNSCAKPPYRWEDNPYVWRIHCKKEQKAF